ncbi:MAG: NAD-dependent epimerase/dehydratase family protein [Gemmatimonadetes bacterium]|nr:NAD-dependent epimerase/dehydratase family protein [Gemmatimonadota bacterium]MBT7860142.1 NAD-dependent epimerase/dehydratase family protein [Gemmatimonadota bacterium]
MKPPILITGATGFIGRYLLRRLCAAGAPSGIRCLVRANSDVAELESLGVELVHGDVTDWEALRAAVDGCRQVVHLANLYSFWERDPSLFRRINVEGTRLTAQAAIEAGVDLFLHVSTVTMFGRPNQVPFNETSPPSRKQFSEYAKTKFEGDEIVESLARNHRLPLAIVYPGSVLGAGDPKSSGRYIADIVHRRMPATLFADRVITWVHVDDVANALQQLLSLDDAAGRRYILGGSRLTIHQLNRLIEAASGVRLPRLELPDRLSLLSARLLTAVAQLTGWSPPFGLSTDVARTMIGGVQADGSRICQDLDFEYTDVRVAVEEAVAALGESVDHEAGDQEAGDEKSVCQESDGI